WVTVCKNVPAPANRQGKGTRTNGQHQPGRQCRQPALESRPSVIAPLVKSGRPSHSCFEEILILIFLWIPFGHQ
ncbi:MAG: hypothetical protein KC553_06055, partial [Nitrospina sp.]|nr:hypothetical protein [Nitrospina sp.]